jgi:hypothetical protein
MIFEPLIRTSTTWSSVFARFAVHLFEGHVTLADMDQMQIVGERWNLQNPGNRVELVVIFPSDARMTHEERTRMARVIKIGEVHRTASATVILAQGMLASMQRSMLTGMLMIAPPPHPAKVFGAIPDALTWLEPHVQGVCGSALKVGELGATLTAHITQFRARKADPPRT